MRIILIAAVDRQFGIAKDGKIPWRLPADIEHFRETTEGHAVIMGRKTWESLPPKFRPLPNRTNVILTTKNRTFEDSLAYGSMHSALDGLRSRKFETVFIIGGEEVYRCGLTFATESILTEIDHEFGCDQFFPRLKDEWKEDMAVFYEADDKNPHDFSVVTYRRITS